MKIKIPTPQFQRGYWCGMNEAIRISQGEVSEAHLETLKFCRKDIGEALKWEKKKI